MAPSLDIVIVNWNAGPLLARCLASIAGARDGSFRLERVVLVDNASTDSSLAEIEAGDLPLVVIRNSANRGFGAACNQGASASRADYVLFLNPDTRLFEDSLSAPIQHLQAADNARVGVCGIQLVDEHGGVAKSCARFPDGGTYLSIATGIDRLLPRAGLGYRMTEWSHAETREVDHVMGAFYLIRAALLRQLAGFDEDYFVYFEDLDLSRRVAAAGYTSCYLSSARAFHLGGGTSRQIKARRLAYFLRGKLRYARKHAAPLSAGLATVATLCLEPLARCAGALLARRPADVLATLAAYGLLLMPEAPAQRLGSPVSAGRRGGAR